MEQKTIKSDADEVMAVYQALVVAFNGLGDTDAIVRRPTLRALSQEIANLAGRAQALSVKYSKSEN